MAEPLPAFVGPHEGRELELLLAGTKPMARLTDEPVANFCHDLTAFQPHIKSGRLIHVEVPLLGGKLIQHYFALPGEEWRIKVWRLIENAITASPKGEKAGFTTNDLHRIDGWLLGYDKADIEAFITRADSRAVK